MQELSVLQKYLKKILAVLLFLMTCVECDILIVSVKKGTHYNTVLPDPYMDEKGEWPEFDESENIEDCRMRQTEILWDVLWSLKEGK